MKNIEIVTERVEFLGEQDGPPEQEFKIAVTLILRTDSQVRRAYLARVKLAEADTPSVVLAIRSETLGSPQLKSQIGQLFSDMFSTSAFLDVMFLSLAQELELGTVCRPFYERAAKPKGWLSRLLQLP